MIKRLGIAAFKAHLTQALREVEAGGRIVVARRGRPIAVLVRPDILGADDFGWFNEVHGVARDIDDFEGIMRGVVRARSKARPSPVRFDG